MDLFKIMEGKGLNKRQEIFVRKLIDLKQEFSNKDLAKIWGASSLPSGLKKKLIEKPAILKLIRKKPQVYALVTAEMKEEEGEILEIDSKKTIEFEFEKLKRSILKERLYFFLFQENKKVAISKLISYFQKFFNKERINSVLLELYFENLIDFKPKVPEPIEKLIKILYRKKEVTFPVYLKVNEFEKILEKNYIDYDSVIDVLKQNPDYVQFSLISIGKERDLIILKHIWKSNSLVWRVN